MKKEKEVVKPQAVEPLSLTVERSLWDRLNKAAKEEGRSKASIIRVGLIAWLDKRDQRQTN